MIFRGGAKRYPFSRYTSFRKAVAFSGKASLKDINKSGINWIATPRDCVGLLYRVTDNAIIEALEVAGKKVTLLADVKATAPVVNLACSDDGRLIVAACSDGSLQCFDVIPEQGITPRWNLSSVHSHVSRNLSETPSTDRSSGAAATGPIESLSFSVGTYYCLLVDAGTKKMMLFDVASKEPVDLLASKHPTRSALPLCGSWFPAGRKQEEFLFAVGLSDGSIAIESFSTNTNKLRLIGTITLPGELRGKSFCCVHLNWCNGGKTMAAGYASVRTTDSTEYNDSIMYIATLSDNFKIQRTRRIGEVFRNPPVAADGRQVFFSTFFATQTDYICLAVASNTSNRIVLLKDGGKADWKVAMLRFGSEANTGRAVPLGCIVTVVPRKNGAMDQVLLVALSDGVLMTYDMVHSKLQNMFTVGKGVTLVAVDRAVGNRSQKMKQEVSTMRPTKSVPFGTDRSLVSSLRSLRPTNSDGSASPTRSIAYSISSDSISTMGKGDDESTGIEVVSATRSLILSPVKPGIQATTNELPPLSEVGNESSSSSVALSPATGGGSPTSKASVTTQGSFKIIRSVSVRVSPKVKKVILDASMVAESKLEEVEAPVKEGAAVDLTTVGSIPAEIEDDSIPEHTSCPREHTVSGSASSRPAILQPEITLSQAGAGDPVSAVVSNDVEVERTAVVKRSEKAAFLIPCSIVILLSAILCAFDPEGSKVLGNKLADLTGTSGALEAVRASICGTTERVGLAGFANETTTVEPLLVSNKTSVVYTASLGTPPLTIQNKAEYDTGLKVNECDQIKEDKAADAEESMQTAGYGQPADEEETIVAEPGEARNVQEHQGRVLLSEEPDEMESTLDEKTVSNESSEDLEAEDAVNSLDTKQKVDDISEVSTEASVDTDDDSSSDDVIDKAPHNKSTGKTEDDHITQETMKVSEVEEDTAEDKEFEGYESEDTNHLVQTKLETTDIEGESSGGVFPTRSASRGLEHQEVEIEDAEKATGTMLDSELGSAQNGDATVDPEPEPNNDTQETLETFEIKQDTTESEHLKRIKSEDYDDDVVPTDPEATTPDVTTVTQTPQDPGLPEVEIEGAEQITEATVDSGVGNAQADSVVADSEASDVTQETLDTFEVEEGVVGDEQIDGFEFRDNNLLSETVNEDDSAADRVTRRHTSTALEHEIEATEKAIGTTETLDDVVVESEADDATQETTEALEVDGTVADDDEVLNEDCSKPDLDGETVNELGDYWSEGLVQKMSNEVEVDIFQLSRGLGQLGASSAIPEAKYTSDSSQELPKMDREAGEPFEEAQDRENAEEDMEVETQLVFSDDTVERAEGDDGGDQEVSDERRRAEGPPTLVTTVIVESSTETIMEDPEEAAEDIQEGGSDGHQERLADTVDNVTPGHEDALAETRVKGHNPQAHSPVDSETATKVDAVELAMEGEETVGLKETQVVDDRYAASTGVDESTKVKAVTSDDELDLAEANTPARESASSDKYSRYEDEVTAPDLKAWNPKELIERSTGDDENLVGFVLAAVDGERWEANVAKYRRMKLEQQRYTDNPIGFVTTL